ncbi:SOS response-associated peptidase [Thalassospira sp.]|uniref:SOS response-associated peptidase n=1 Tax=Thalassospira sp. TaxID=1912094 RepID=UPI0027370329|nr:SOS response-associated peptidase family protein [Thalassospira sp.]MDP2696812.1 SOS response-associated peptidase family protein [Thalassospira sp.]
MCSKYDFGVSAASLATFPGLEISVLRQAVDDHFPDHPDNAQIDTLSGPRRPTDAVWIIGMNGVPTIRRWGLKVIGVKGPVINARAESLDHKPAFQDLLMQRCLIPATRWSEWRKDGSTHHQNHITLPGHTPFFFAGLENGVECVIITCAPAPAIAHIHDRMPAIIGPTHHTGWLDAQQNFSKVFTMLRPVPDAVLKWQEDLSAKQQPGLFEDAISLQQDHLPRTAQPD